MIVCLRVMCVHVMAGKHVVMTLLDNRDRADRCRLPRAQHGSRYRTPDGKQDGDQDEDEDAEVLHHE